MFPADTPYDTWLASRMLTKSQQDERDRRKVARDAPHLMKKTGILDDVLTTTIKVHIGRRSTESESSVEQISSQDQKHKKQQQRQHQKDKVLDLRNGMEKDFRKSRQSNATSRQENGSKDKRTMKPRVKRRHNYLRDSRSMSNSPSPTLLERAIAPSRTNTLSTSPSVTPDQSSVVSGSNMRQAMQNNDSTENDRTRESTTESNERIPDWIDDQLVVDQKKNGGVDSEKSVRLPSIFLAKDQHQRQGNDKRSRHPSEKNFDGQSLTGESLLEQITRESKVRAKNKILPKTLIPTEYHISKRSPMINTDDIESGDAKFDAGNGTWELKIFPSELPADREQVNHLADTMEKMMHRTMEKAASLDVVQRALAETDMLSIVARELVRQVQLHCTTRGVLLDRVFQEMQERQNVLAKAVKRAVGMVQEMIRDRGDSKEKLRQQQRECVALSKKIHEWSTKHEVVEKEHAEMKSALDVIERKNLLLQNSYAQTDEYMENQWILSSQLLQEKPPSAEERARHTATRQKKKEKSYANKMRTSVIIHREIDKIGVNYFSPRQEDMHDRNSVTSETLSNPLDALIEYEERLLREVRGTRVFDASNDDDIEFSENEDVRMSDDEPMIEDAEVVENTSEQRSSSAEDDILDGQNENSIVSAEDMQSDKKDLPEEQDSTSGDNSNAKDQDLKVTEDGEGEGEEHNDKKENNEQDMKYLLRQAEEERETMRQESESRERVLKDEVQELREKLLEMENMMEERDYTSHPSEDRQPETPTSSSPDDEQQSTFTTRSSSPSHDHGLDNDSNADSHEHRERNAFIRGWSTTNLTQGGGDGEKSMVMVTLTTAPDTKEKLKLDDKLFSGRDKGQGKQTLSGRSSRKSSSRSRHQYGPSKDMSFMKHSTEMLRTLSTERVMEIIEQLVCQRTPRGGSRAKRGLKWINKIILDICLDIDRHSTELKHFPSRLDMVRQVYEWFLVKYGLGNIAMPYLDDFLRSLKKYVHNNARVHAFCQFTGLCTWLGVEQQKEYNVDTFAIYIRMLTITKNMLNKKALRDLEDGSLALSSLFISILFERLRVAMNGKPQPQQATQQLDILVKEGKRAALEEVAKIIVETYETGSVEPAELAEPSEPSHNSI